VAKQVHHDQVRDEGSPYISHCIAVARKAIQFGGDVHDVIVCLLHDSYEDFNGDRDMYYEQIKNEFGEDTANSIVRLSKWKSKNKIDGNEYLAELSTDMLNLKRKGYDRISNLQSLRFSDETKRVKYLAETEGKYIPLFESFYPELSNQMKKIIGLYHANQLSLTEQEEKIVRSFKQAKS
jgi:GTP pyrophosphokinase